MVDIDNSLLEMMLTPKFARAGAAEQALLLGSYELTKKKEDLPHRNLGDTFIGFIQACNKKYVPEWFHLEVAGCLEKCLTREITRLAIFMPPRCGKSELVSRYFPAYALGKNGDEKIIHSSYGSDLSEAMGRDVMNIMSLPEYQQIFATRLASGMPTYVDPQRRRRIRKTKETNSKFEVANGFGYMLCSGVGGAQTGHGMTLGIIDDPLKNRMEANSKAIQSRNKDWYTSSFDTRGEGGQSPGGADVQIICQTLWCDREMISHILRWQEQLDEEWVVLRYPAEKEAPGADAKLLYKSTPGYVHDLRAIGEPLYPSKFDTKKLQRTKQKSPADWNALQQQRPSPPGGGMFKRSWWKLYDLDELQTLVARRQIKKKAFSIDCAFKGSSSGSRVALGLFNSTRTNHYLVEGWAGYWNWLETKDLCKTVWSAHPDVLTKYVEAKANGHALISEMEQYFSGIIAINPKDSKEDRAATVADIVRAGNVYLPKYSAMTDLIIEEGAAYPGGATNDMIDMLVQYLLEQQDDGLAWLEGMTND